MMKFIAILLMALSIGACQPQGSLPVEPPTAEYTVRQDYASCVRQPRLRQCENACKTQSYSWCYEVRK